MASPADGRGGDDSRRLAEVFHFLLSNDSPAPFSRSQLRSGEDAGPDGLQHLLSVTRRDEGPDVDLDRRLAGAICHPMAVGRKGFEASREAKVILDANRLVRCVSAGARRLLALGPESSDQIFHYFFQPGKPALIYIERPDRTVGVGRLLAVNTRWEGKAAFLVTVQDVTHLERKRVAARL